MRVIEARNAHQALAVGLKELFERGVQRDSRNGPVLQMPTPVTTVYQRPTERVVFWSQRDANPFFHLYESLWMLAGRNDLTGLLKFNKQMAAYSDDNVTVNGSAYGYRWRRMFDPTDQLTEVVALLRRSPTERRAVLQMWDAGYDLGSSSKDVPCNTMATLQINTEGALDLTVFCRSNDIVWGAYGANAVHFSVLLEYLASAIGVPVGRYYQISVNWHGYLSTIEPLRAIAQQATLPFAGPYAQGLCVPVEMFDGVRDMEQFDILNNRLLLYVDTEELDRPTLGEDFAAFPFFSVAYRMFLAHQIYRHLRDANRYEEALNVLSSAPVNVDWIRAGREWLQRRLVKWQAKSNADQIQA